MGKPKKSTKKFLKLRLKDELTRRKQHKEATKHLRKNNAVSDPKNQESVQHNEDDQDNESNASSDAGFGPSYPGQNEDSTLIDPFQEESDEEDEDASESDEDIENMQDEDFDSIEDANEADDDELDEDALSHVQQMELLKVKDPKFYQYLQENDQQLLNFADLDDDQEEPRVEKAESDSEDSTITVTPAMVKEWKSKLSKQKSTKCIHKVLLAFRAAVVIDNETETNSNFTYRIEGEKMFNTVVLIALKYSPIVFDHALFGSKNDKPRKGLPSGAKKWKLIHRLVKSFLIATLKLMEQMTDMSMLSFILKQCESAVSYFACFPKQCKDFTKRIVNYLAFAEQEQVRIMGFLCLRRLAIAAPNPNLQTITKQVYSAFLEVARSTNVHTWTHVDFMSNCIVELCGIHLFTTYQLAFVYIRQMAIKLRSVIITKTKDSYRTVYNWQFLQSIRMWSRVLSTYCDRALGKTKESEILQPLIYPLVQVAIGVIKVKPSSRYFPFRMHIIKALIELMEKTGTFIPVAAYLFDILHSAEVSGKSKPSTLKSLDLLLTIQAPNSYLGTKTYQRGLISETVHILFDYYSNFSLSISFPEIVIPAIIELKHMTKNSKDVNLNKTLGQLTEKLEQNSAFIQEKRVGLDFGPKDMQRTEEFLGDLEKDSTPLGKFNAARHKMRIRQKPEDKYVPSNEDDEEDQEEEILGSESENSNEDEAEEPIHDTSKPNGAGTKRKHGESKPSMAKPTESGKKIKTAKQAKPTKKANDYEIDGDEDVVDDFVLSDDE
ncbi:hypothetical protein BDV3_005225 [Batrachochytrium dendrobatidis]|nr:hypothetical protein BDEG_23242 [Batrachochytrium dendrobatidis JEL423]